MSCINDLDPSKYNAQQMNVISRFRHDSEITKNIDDLDPSIYSAKHMSSISFIRGNYYGDQSSVEDLDPKKFSSDQMSLISKYRKNREIKNSDFEGIDLGQYDYSDFEKLINEHDDLSNIKIVSIKDKINTSIERLKEELLEDDYETLFNDPVSNDNLNELSLKIGIEIPESLDALLKINNGQKENNFSFFGNYQFLSSDMIMKEWSIWNELLLKGTFKLKSK